MSTAGGFTNNIGNHEICLNCGKPEYQHGDPALWPGDTHYCHCTPNEKAASAARALDKKLIGFSEFKRIVRMNS